MPGCVPLPRISAPLLVRSAQDRTDFYELARVSVTRISLARRTNWLASLASATPPYTIVEQPQLQPTATSHLWNGRLDVNIVSCALSHRCRLFPLADLSSHQVEKRSDESLNASGGVADAESADADGDAAPAVVEAEGDGGALPSADKLYDLAVSFRAPEELGGAAHTVAVPIQLDEPFVVLDWPRAGADAPPPQSPPRTRDVAAVEGGGEAAGGSTTPELAGSAVRVPLPPDSPLNI